MSDLALWKGRKMSELTPLPLFESWDSHRATDIAAMGVGMAGVASGSAMALATPAFFDFVPKRRSKPLPHWIVVRTDSWGIHLHSADRNGAEGPLITEAASGTFRATLHHYLGEVILTIFIRGQESISLKGKSGPIHHHPNEVARTVVSLADRS